MVAERVIPVKEPSPEPQQVVRQVPSRALRQARIQLKLKVGGADDPLEREADRVADGIMRGAPVGEPMVPRLALDGPTRIRRSTVEPDTLRRGASVGAKPWRGLRQAPSSTIQRNEESAALLTKLATPKARAGPEIAAQKTVVDELLKQELPDSATILNLGAIALTKISDDDDEVVDQAIAAGLVDPTPYGYIGMKAWKQVAAAKVAGPLIRNTLRTMIDAEQVQYLRKAGLPNKDFIILVEIHFYLSRDMDQWGFHKDTKGSTLFVNLNYHMNQAVVGPEFVVNPPVTPEHDRGLGIADGVATDGSLPKEFNSDLLAARGELGDPKEIGNKSVPAYGYVAFVDEAIHHATPLYGHRSVTGGHFKKFIETTYPEKFKAAQKGYAGWKKSWTGAAFWGFETYLDPGSPIKDNEAAKWLAWMKIADDSKKDAKTQRPKFLATGMTKTEVDEMLETIGELTKDEKDGRKRPAADSAYFRDAAVPMPGNELAIRSPLKKEGRPALTRTMSQSALDKTLPPPAESARRFFRTWVRAVRPKAPK